MKRYHLKILFPSTSSDTHSFNKVVEASYFNTVVGGAHLFFDSTHNVVASYPVNFTIIEKIETVK